jgi:MFS family permease
MVVPRRLALIGAIAMAVAQISIGMADAPANIPALAVSMFSQGVGLGLFQVACFDISTATIPRDDRGVAGSLVMMTRTVGVVTGATVLMLIFQTVQSGGGTRVPAARRHSWRASTRPSGSPPRCPFSSF